jgi:hypothetical protein
LCDQKIQRIVSQIAFEPILHRAVAYLKTLSIAPPDWCIATVLQSLRPPARPISYSAKKTWAHAWPAAGQPSFHELSYYMHEGGHGMVSSDWSIYIEFGGPFLRMDILALDC